jgi:hypothetical protein
MARRVLVMVVIVALVLVVGALGGALGTALGIGRPLGVVALAFVGATAAGVVGMLRARQ